MSAKAKVLIIDDSSFSRRNLRQHLEAMGHLVEEAEDGTQALERFVVSPPDLVVLDLVMPGMNGTEVLSKLRQLSPKIPVIIATSDVQKATLDEVKRAGAQALLNKPVSRPLLEQSVASALSGGNSWS
jgi:two-component system chemotaxis response regulator CheY